MQKTGKAAPETGHYKDKHGHEIVINRGETLPPCPLKKDATKWKPAGKR